MLNCHTIMTNERDLQGKKGDGRDLNVYLLKVYLNANRQGQGTYALQQPDTRLSLLSEYGDINMTASLRLSLPCIITSFPHQSTQQTNNVNQSR
jgi:hypothetical protein